MEGMRQEINKLKLETEQLKKENSDLRKGITILEDSLDEVEQYSRKSCLI